MKISCAINSKNPDPKLLSQCVKSASMFDEVVLYIDGVKRWKPTVGNNGIRVVGDGKKRNIVEGFNYVIRETTGEWVCPFCDDDYFHETNMRECLDRIRSGHFDQADIVHSQVFVGGGTWGESAVSYESLRQRNQIPHGSIFRRSVFDELGGYELEAYTDWDLWLRMAKAGKRFMYFEKPTYYFRFNRAGGAMHEQVKRFGGHNAIRDMVLANVEGKE